MEKTIPIKVIIILGSGPNATKFKDMDKNGIDHIIAINNAWKISSNWDELIYPEDFPISRRPYTNLESKKLTSADTYVDAQNEYGGFVYAGGTMAFTAGYYALSRYKPKTIAFIGCDMVYPEKGKTHFYGNGSADPLRDDITLQCLEAKATRLLVHAAKQGCSLVNLSNEKSRLTFPRANITQIKKPIETIKWSSFYEKAALKLEKKLNYFIKSGEYWKHQHIFDKSNLAKIDQLWLNCINEQN